MGDRGKQGSRGQTILSELLATSVPNFDSIQWRPLRNALRVVPLQEMRLGTTSVVPMPR